MSDHYRALVGLNWPPDVRREPGDDVSDMPRASLQHELAAGHVKVYDPADAHPTTPLPALDPEEG